MITSVFARLLYRELSSRGLTDFQLFHGTKLSRREVWSARALPNTDFLQLLRNARALIAPEPLGLMIGALHRTPAVNMTGLAMTSAPTLREGLQAMASYSVLAAEYARIEVQAGPGTARLVLNFDDLIGDCRDIHTEAVLVLLQNYLESMVGIKHAGMHFTVTFPAPPHAAAYARHLHGPVTFSSDADAIHIPDNWLDTQSPFSDPDLWAMSRRHLSAQLEEAKTSRRAPYTQHLQTVFAAHIPPLPELNSTAESLHLSTRTLNRRLHAEGTTFRAQRIAATHEWGKRLLQDGISVEAVALQLGYDNPANFRRAFRRATGMSPTAWLEGKRDDINHDARIS